MARFYFHIRDRGHFLEDRVGDDLANLATARSEALAIARSLLADRIQAGKSVAGQAVEVTDESGATVASVAFLAALDLSDGE